MWLEQPQKELPKSAIPLLRAASGKTVEANLTGRPMRLYVHFAKQRSWPCTGTGCGLCGKGIARRYYAYYPVAGQEGNVGMIELTAQAEDALIKLMEPNITEPSGRISLHRPGGRRNMPCTVDWSSKEIYRQTGGGKEKVHKQTASNTLSEKELKDALMRIWKLPIFNGTLSEREYLTKLNRVIAVQTKSLG